MNWQKGDLAMVVREHHKCPKPSEPRIGTVFTVLEVEHTTLRCICGLWATTLFLRHDIGRADRWRPASDCIKLKPEDLANYEEKSRELDAVS
jgi:hypothetical protein